MTRQDLDASAEQFERVIRLQSKGPCVKKTFRTKRKAVVALDRIKEATKHRNGKSDLPRSIYQCKRCSFWHLTSYES